MAKWRIRTIVLMVVKVYICALGVIFMSSPPALPRNRYHDWKENRNTMTGRFTTSNTSVSLETHNISKNQAFSILRPVQLLANKNSYMLALHYFDQLTSATTNLQSLMCLAKKIGGVQVVEPFVMGSLLGLNVSANWTEEVRMSDIFDYEAWKRTVPFKKYGELVSFQNFLQNAPRKLLMVQYCSRGDLCYPCKHDDIIFRTRLFCKLHNFELVGHECFSYEKEKMISFSSIKSLLYSKYNKSELVVMFDLYGGINSRSYDPHKPYRFFANIKDCGRDEVTRFYALHPSWSVLSDADKYIQTYLNSLAYVAVMIRLEKIFRLAKIDGNEHWKDQPSLAKQCFTNVLQRLEEIKKTFGLDHVFVTIDIGHYGSLYFRKKNDGVRAIERETEDFLSAIYRRNMTLGEYEERHISTSRNKNLGYISVVQKQIAARGDVLVLVGRDSTYQLSAKELYYEHHKNKTKHVYYV